MSRFERDFGASTNAPLSVAELLAILGGQPGAREMQRQQAIACFLSASEGWSEAAKSLGGTFASEGSAQRLKDGKAE